MKLLITTLLLAVWLNASFYKNANEGWFAYKDANLTQKIDTNETIKEEVKKVAKKEIQLPKNLNDLSAKEFEELMTDAKGIMTMNPTKENVKKYLVLQNFVNTQAEKLTDQWGEVMLENPELDYSVNVAKTSFAKNAFHLTNKEEMAQFFKEYSKYITLVMFYDSNKVEVTQKQDHVMRLISYDYPELEQLKIDATNPKSNNLLKQLKISTERLPDIFIMINSGQKQQWKRVAINLTTKEKIISKIYEYTQKIFKKGEEK